VVVSQGSGSLPVRTLAIIPLITTLPGTLDVTVDWTFASNNVDVYLARGSCSFEQFVATQCQVLSTSESATAKPEKLRVPGTTAGTYTLLVGNRGPADESVAYQVVLTPSAASAGSVAARTRMAEPVRIRAYERSTALGQQ
jgi:hypothetical protein